MSHEIGVWVAAFFTLGILSFLYRDNPIYKFCEGVFIGISAGYWFVYAIHSTLVPKLIDPITGGHLSWGMWLYYGLAVLFGGMFLMRLIPGIGWVSRYPMAFIVGLTAGLSGIVYAVQTSILAQLEGTMVPLWTPGELIYSLSQVVMIVGVITTLIYFFFSKPHKGALGVASRVGIYFLMISFGASFGYTVMARISLLTGRLYFLLHDWIGAVG